MEDNEMVIDGSTLEGGGQVVRLASSLGVGRFSLVRIRAGREKSGLKAQHLAALRLVAEIRCAKLTGDALTSTQIEIEIPKEVSPLRSEYRADAGTAGATTLILQAVLPALIRRLDMNQEVSLVLRGGTNTRFSPSADHVALVLAPNLYYLGLSVRVDSIKRGFFPEGGGCLALKIKKIPPTPFLWSEPEARPLTLTGAISGRGALLTEKFDFAERLEEILRTRFPSLDTHCIHMTSDFSRPHFKKSTLAVQLALRTSSGATIGVDLLTENFTKIPNLDALALQLVNTLAQKVHEAGAGVDEQTADQLAAFLAFLPSPSALRCPVPTCLHLETVLHFASLFTGAKYHLSTLPSVVSSQDATTEEDRALSRYTLIRCEGGGS